MGCKLPFHCRKVKLRETEKLSLDIASFHPEFRTLSRFWEFGRVFLLFTDESRHDGKICGARAGSYMNKAYFVSDAHLGVSKGRNERERLAMLLDLIETARREEADLYIVGDLFDFWFEYRHVVPRGAHRLLTSLENLTSEGRKVFYFAGNHDFAIGNFFAEDLGIAVVKDGLEFTIGDSRFSVCHGDGFEENDAGYRMLKRLLRNRFAQWCFRWLHPDLGFGLARVTSKSSRRYTSNRRYGDGMRKEALRRIESGADYVIMGHLHKPVMEKMAGGIYVNLGDWLTHFTYAVFKDNNMQLLSMRNGTIPDQDSQ